MEDENEWMPKIGRARIKMNDKQIILFIY